jgi:hypothetical protein
MRKVNPMKTRYGLIILAAIVGVLFSGCATAARRNTALAAAQYGTDVGVLDKLERGARLGLGDLGELGRRGVPENVILAHLQRRDDVYRLTTGEVLQLREAGVSDRLIDYLLASPDQLARRGPRIYRGGGYGYRGYSGNRIGGFGHRGRGRHR